MLLFSDGTPAGNGTGSPKPQRKNGQTNGQNGNKVGDLRRSGLLQRFDPKNNLQPKGLLPRSQTLPDFDRPKLTRQAEATDPSASKRAGFQKTASVAQMPSNGVLRSALKISTSDNRLETATSKPLALENGHPDHQGPPALLSPSKLNEIHEEVEMDVTPTPEEPRTATPVQTDPLTLTPSAMRIKGGKMQWPPVLAARRLSGGAELGGLASPAAVPSLKEKDVLITKENGVPEKPSFPASLQGERWWCLLHTPKPPLDQILPSYMKTGCIAARLVIAISCLENRTERDKSGASQANSSADVHKYRPANRKTIRKTNRQTDR